MVKKQLNVEIIIAVSLIFLIFLSSTVTGTFSWYTSVTKVSSFSGTTSYSATLTLFAKQADGSELSEEVLVENSSFILVKMDENGDFSDTSGQSVSFTGGIQIGGIYTTDSMGEITADNLTSGEYCFVKISTAYGYTYDMDESENIINEYFFTLGPDVVDENDSISITAYNRIVTGDLTITNTVENYDGTELLEEQIEKEFTVYIDLDTEDEYYYDIDGGELTLLQGEIILKHGQSATVYSIPIGTSYTVTEVSEQDYTCEIQDFTGNIAEAGNIVDINYIYKTEEIPAGETLITITKEVLGYGYDEDTEFEIFIDIDGEITEVRLKAGEETVLTVPNGAVYKIYSVAILSDGFVIESVSSGYGVAMGGSVSAAVTSRYVLNTTTEITVTKLWDVPDNITLPDSITVSVYNGFITVATADITAEESWEYTFENLPELDDNGSVIQYEILEAPEENYITNIDGYTITNTYEGTEVPSLDDIEISGEVFWEHGDNTDLPEQVVISIISDNQVVTAITVTVETDWQWSATLPKYDSDGKIIDYTIEVSELENYITVIDGYNITNTYSYKESTVPDTGSGNDVCILISMLSLSVIGIIYSRNKSEKALLLK